MAKERTCMICGFKYKFCHHCREYQGQPGWKYLYHDEKCKQIGDLWYAYRGGEISKETAKKALSKLTPNIDNALKYTGTIASNEIREIFDTVENEPEQNIENVQEVKIEEQNVSEKPVRKRNQKKENHESE